jgi:hypothetical protein
MTETNFPRQELKDHVPASHELPPLIDSPYPQVAIKDLLEIGQSFDSSLTSYDIEPFEIALHESLRQYAPENTTFYAVGATNLSETLEAMAEAETQRIEQNVGVVHLDKYIGANSDNPSYFRLNVSRGADNKLVSRVGTLATPEEQMGTLVQWAQTGNYDQLVLVDDVLAFGSTVPPLIEKLRGHLPDTEFRLLVGLAASGGAWRGFEKVQEDTGITPEYLTKIIPSKAIENGTKGMSIPVSRDLTLFGGKAGKHESGAQLSYPYFMPFSMPLASLLEPKRQLEASYAMLDFNDMLVASLEARIGRELNIGDLVAADFGVPLTSIDSLKEVMQPPSSETTLSDYLEYARQILLAHGGELTKEGAK